MSESVEKVISDVTSRLVDPDLAMLFTNALPNTLDTTVAWHVNASSNSVQKRSSNATWPGAQSFIITGDIDAEWLRDSVNQVMNYQTLAKADAALYQLILGAINTQSEFIINYPFCGAFQPPSPSGLAPTNNTQIDTVTPNYDRTFVYECKYELDSLAAFLSLGNQFYNATGSTEYLSDRWYTALDTVLQTLDDEAQPTFDSNGQFVTNVYTWQRQTTLGTETLTLTGEGNPLNKGIGLIRSAFRPSDDATIFGYFIPANAMMSVQLGRTADTLEAVGGNKTLIDDLRTRSANLRKAVLDHGIFEHPTYGKVFAFEVDGYGGRNVMDDANIPSLLALPYLGFLDVDDKTYQNTRKMVLSADGNPYYLSGSAFHGIGGPHGKYSFSDRLVRRCSSRLLTVCSIRGLNNRMANVTPRSSPNNRRRYRNHGLHQPRGQLESSGTDSRIHQRQQHHRLYETVVRMGQLLVLADHSQDCRGEAILDFQRQYAIRCSYIDNICRVR